MSKQLTREEILEQHSDSRYSISHPFTGQDIIEAMQQYADQETTLTESQRQSWAEMCIKKQARIEELEEYIAIEELGKNETDKEIERLKGLIETLFLENRQGL